MRMRTCYLLSLICKTRSMSYNYWNDPKIHYLGNEGPGGRIHSMIAPIFNSFLEEKVYCGKNVRYDALLEVKNTKKKGDYKNICDFCCGVGISTLACRRAFPESIVLGIDTSKEMLDYASLSTKNMCDYLISNAESYIGCHKFDLITIMFSLHEIPKYARIKILKNIKRNLNKNGRVLILDVSPNYKITKMMEGGEPYVREYVKEINSDINNEFMNVQKTDVVPYHLTQWICY